MDSQLTVIGSVLPMRRSRITHPDPASGSLVANTTYRPSKLIAGSQLLASNCPS